MGEVLDAYNLKDQDTCMVFGKKFPNLPANRGVKNMLLNHRNKHNSRDVITCNISQPKVEKFPH